MKMTPVDAYLVSAISVMIAAYGFLYNSLREHLDAANAVKTRPVALDVFNEQLAIAKRGRRVAFWMALAPTIAWIIFLKRVVEECERAAEVHFSLARYSTLDVAFVALTFALLVIAIFATIQLCRFAGKVSWLEAGRPKTGGP